MSRPRLPIRALLRRDEGTAAVEFGLVASVLLVLMLGTIDVGRLLWIQHSLSTRVSDALRYASLRGAGSGHPASAEQVVAYLRQGLGGTDPERLAVEVGWEPDNRPNARVTVDARYVYDSILTPLMPVEGLVLRSTKTTIVIN